MGDSADSVARDFLATWEKGDADEIAKYFSDEGVWIDGPRGIFRGREAVTAELRNVIAMSGSVTVDIKSLLSDGRTVMMERVDSFQIGGKPFSMDVMASIEVEDGRITRWRDSYDLKSVVDQIEAAGIDAPD